ncbi:MAG TPA: SurA N-terminal domain-containing protein, partial [Kofleriaceae bacterium]|nr:SurA N-terminal domain-containing protein [Kofleriaceae bacterium]
MRRQGASIFIYLIFGLLIVIFVINFAPTRNRGGMEGGCGPSSNTAVTVDGIDANHTAYLIAYSANGASGRQKVYMALDAVIRRELLAQAAGERGIRTSGDLVDEEIKRGAFFLGGQRIDFTRQFFDEVDGEKFFNIKRFKGWVNSLNVSPGSYREEQARGMQASMMAELLTSSVRVSREEALANYLYENNTVTYDVVAFDPGKYKVAMRLGDADIKRFLEGHQAEVQARYKADERLYKATKPQLALREIFIPKAYPQLKPADDKPAGQNPADQKPADPKAGDKAGKPTDDKAAGKAKPDQAGDKAADKAGGKAADKAGDKVADKARPADKKPADKARPADKKADKVADKKPADDKADKKPAVGDPANPRGLPTDVAKAKLEAAREAIAAGKLKFTDAEKQLAADSSDDVPADNGDRGWRSVDSAGLGDKAVNDAVKTLKPGEMTPVIVTERGAYLVMATDKREGDLSFDQVKSEIAAELARDVWSKEAAKRDALEALARAKSSGKNLDQLFERELV